MSKTVLIKERYQPYSFLEKMRGKIWLIETADNGSIISRKRQVKKGNHSNSLSAVASIY